MCGNVAEIHSLLQHVLDDNCTDPDCEIHHIDVAVEEEVIRQTDLAFWLAGALSMSDKHQGLIDQVEEWARRLA